MDNVLKLEISQKLNALKAEYTNGGQFSQDDLQKDLDDLNNLVHIEVLDRMFDLKPPPAKLNSEKEVADYIDANFSKDEIQTITYSAAEEIFSGWLTSMGIKEN